MLIGTTFPPCWADSRNHLYQLEPNSLMFFQHPRSALLPWSWLLFPMLPGWVSQSSSLFFLLFLPDLLVFSTACLPHQSSGALQTHLINFLLCWSYFPRHASLVLSSLYVLSTDTNLTTFNMPSLTTSAHGGSLCKWSWCLSFETQHIVARPVFARVFLRTHAPWTLFSPLPL